MKEHPILFNSEMVRAILEGRKTQTRRIIKPRHGGVITGSAAEPFMAIEAYGGGKWHIPSRMEATECPYGVPGDRLWVRETHFQTIQNAGHDRPYICYAEEESILKKGDWKRVPSIHMPRWASRITLEVTGVRVERVQEISKEDAVAEGVILAPDTLFPQMNKQDKQREQFPHLWDSINAKRGYGWDVNPWVWVVEFKTNGENR